MDFTAILTDKGLAVAELIAVGLGLAYMCRWLAKNVVAPVVTAHVGLLNALQAQMPNQTQKLTDIVGWHGKHDLKLDRLIQATDNNTAVLERAIENQTIAMSIGKKD